MRGDLFALRGGELAQSLFSHGQHTAGAAGAIVQQIGSRFDFLGNGQEDQLCHQLDGVARRPVLTRLFVVLLVETAHQFLEDRAHGMVVEAGMLDRTIAVDDRSRAEVDVGRKQLLNQRTQCIGLGKARNLVAELEVLQDVLHVGRKAVQVCLKVSFELLLAGAVSQVPQGEPGSVVEGLAGGLPQRLVLVHDASAVQCCLHGEHSLFGRLQFGIQATQYRHRQNNVPVFAAHIEIAQHVIGNAPDVVGDPIQLGLFHEVSRLKAVT